MTEPRPGIGEQVAHLAARMAAGVVRAVGLPADVDPLPPRHRKPDPHVDAVHDEMFGDGPAALPPADDQLFTPPYRSAANLNTLGARESAAAINQTNASLREAALCMRRALVTADPDPKDPIGPIDMGILVGMIGVLFTELDRLIAAAQQHLAAAHRTAGTGGWLAPPAASAPAEVEAVIRDLLRVHEGILTAGDRLDQAGQRLQRLRTGQRHE
jgi:hypothetical protein